MARIVLGVFTKRDDAEGAIARLEGAGYSTKDMSIVMREEGARAEPGHTAGHMAEGAVSGATTGGAIGVLAGLLLANGFFPGLGTLLIGGPIATALGLSGVAATAVSGALTGAAAGGLLGALSGFGLSHEEASEYEKSIKDGGILVIVPARLGEEDEVRAIMREYSAGQVRSIESIESRSRRAAEEEYAHRHI